MVIAFRSEMKNIIEIFYLDIFLHFNNIKINEGFIKNKHKFFIKYLFIVKDEFNRTLLHFASNTNNITIVEYLLKLNFEPNVKTDIGWTPLHFACYYKSRINLIKLLIKHGANINSKTDNNGWTPLHYSVKLDDIETVRFLLVNGANLHIKDNDGHAPKDLIKSNEMKELLEVECKII